MARKPLPLLALLYAMLVLALLGGCQPRAVIHRTEGKVFGTRVEVSIYGEPEQRAAALAAQVLREFDRLHHKFHAWQPSDLTALNERIARGEEYAADQEMVDILQAAAGLAESSDNLFNPAIGRLIRLWGFQSSDITAQRPAPAEIRKWVDANPRMSDLRFDGTRIRSVNKAVMLDLGGYAKGYALDRAAQILRGAGVKAALINVGGNMLALGRPGERPWRVGIKDPRGDGAMAAVELHDNEAIGTSGDYQRYYMQDGKRRPHIIDPRSGESVDVMASVTIITSGGSDPGTRSDGKSKPLFLAGPGQWRAMAERLGLHEVMVVDTEGRVDMTEEMRRRLVTP
ncbi:MAG TPA: FAD:protein FMN transferase [Noviherbaspirillum sp.]|uniref:FAD:protein FMN transferase n=1 Tax=Noviherbaspirillum sp. TaxID=1926288 RepID=UPI002D740AA2|nr:FAD:protein FMN transferase [Noviherbaspirillum sp.]HYD95880.1 FAD:protein FMN transferase [Noviherbaspirillum sp.]